MGGCQNYCPFLGTLDIRCRIMIGIQKGTIILTTTHITPIYTLDKKSMATTSRLCTIEKAWPRHGWSQAAVSGLGFKVELRV